jgi:hypothetical protein
MSREKCTVCIGRGCHDIEAYHEISSHGNYIHLCDMHFWMLAEYFGRWTE